MSPVVLHSGSTRQVIDGEISVGDLQQKVLHACAELEKKCDLLIIEGAGHVGVGSVIKLSNARIAKLLNAPVLMVTGGGLGNVVDSVYMNLALFQKEGVDVRAILTNKLIPEKRDTSLDYLRRCFAEEPFKVLAGFDYHPLLANPTLRRISNLLEVPLHGNKRDNQRIINHVQIGAASTQRVVEILQDSTLLIVTSSRDELLVTMANLYQIPAYRSKIVGLLIPGLNPVSTITQQILDRSNIPYLRTQNYSTAELYRIITEDVSKLTAEDTEKLALVRKLAEDTFDFDSLDSIFA
jgi:BioD-like phosphotransacetylase family protein